MNWFKNRKEVIGESLGALDCDSCANRRDCSQIIFHGLKVRCADYKQQDPTCESCGFLTSPIEACWHCPSKQKRQQQEATIKYKVTFNYNVENTVGHGSRFGESYNGMACFNSEDEAKTYAEDIKKQFMAGQPAKDAVAAIFEKAIFNYQVVEINHEDGSKLYVTRPLSTAYVSKETATEVAGQLAMYDVAVIIHNRALEMERNFYTIETTQVKNNAS